MGATASLRTRLEQAAFHKRIPFDHAALADIAIFYHPNALTEPDVREDHDAAAIDVETPAAFRVADRMRVVGHEAAVAVAGIAIADYHDAVIACVAEAEVADAAILAD